MINSSVLFRSMKRLGIIKGNVGKLLCTQETYDKIINHEKGIAENPDCILWTVNDCVLEVCVPDFIQLKYGEVLLENMKDSLERITIDLAS